VPESIEYPAVPLDRFLSDSARAYPDRTAVEFFGKGLAYRELDRQVNRFANVLRSLGVGVGDRVALHLPNVPQFVIAFYAVLRAGGTAVPFNPLYTEREITRQLADSDARVSITLDLFLDKVLAAKAGSVGGIAIATGIQDALPFPLNYLYPLKARREGQWKPARAGDGVHLMSQLIAGAPDRAVETMVDLDRPAVLQYTGGTTGTPKGAILTHRNLVVNAVQVAAWMPAIRPGAESVLAVIPFFHIYGLTVAMNLAVLKGATMHLLPRFDVTGVLKTIQRKRPTLVPGVPAMYNALLNHPDIGRYDLRSIEACISGAAALPLEVQRRFEEVTDGKLVEGYGLTEASPVTHCSPISGTRKPGTIGIPFPDTDACIKDIETGTRVLGTDEVGELCIRGPQVMAGYWNWPDETALALRDGWLHTGDIAAMDTDGFFRIVDRKKDMVIVNGMNVYPREVEEVLYAHPAVLEAAAIGIPDEKRGEVVKAVIVLKPHHAATADEIIQHCQRDLAHFKVPRVIEFTEVLPKSLIGKVLRREIRERQAAPSPEGTRPAG
jgi:long-chain acyl-CoA synthetase